MKLIVDNPFRVLGLPATATSREISKRVSDLETFAELGKTKKYDADLAVIGAVERTVAAVKAAAQKIEQAESKLFHSFFWFRSGHEADAKALAALAAGDHGQALATWNQELSNSGQKRYSSHLNRAVLKLWLATQGSTFDRSKFADALEDIGFVIDNHLDKSVDDVLDSAAAGLNREALWKRVADSLVNIAQSVPGNPYGTNAMALCANCWTFPPSTLDYIKTQVTNPVLERVEVVVDASKARRKSAEKAADLDAHQQFKEAEMLLVELQLALGEEDPRFQAIANDFSEEICDCAVMAYNKFDNLDLAIKFMDWSVRMPSFGRVKALIAENKVTLDCNVEHTKNEKYIEPVAKVLKSVPQSLPEAEAKLEQLKLMLSNLKTTLGAMNPLYIDTSSRCAYHILGCVIDVGNAAQESASGKTLEQMRIIMSQCVALTRKLLPMDLDAECHGRVTKNLEVMESIQRKVDAIAEAQPQPSSWGGIVIFCILALIYALIAMFK